MEMSAKLRIAVVCSSNQNRSMEAHNLLSKKGFDVQSYGTGSVVKLPGPAPELPNVYEFVFEHVEQTVDSSLQTKLKELELTRYTQNGILHMLDRNRRIKPKPESFQNTDKHFDVIFTTEERIYDAVVETLESNGSSTFRPVHIINIDIKDNHEEATLGAFLILKLCNMLKLIDDLEDDMEGIIHDFEEENRRTLLHCLQFY